MVNALVVCRAGVGSSMLLQTKIEQICAKRGYRIDVTHGKLDDLVDFGGDVIVTMSDFAPEIEGKFPNVISIFDITNDDEIASKLDEFVSANSHGASAADDKKAVDVFLGIMKEQVNSFIDGIDYDSITAAKRLIQESEANGGRLHVTGIGKPGHVSGYAASLFSSTGTPTYELHGTECVHGSAGQVKPGDVVIAISNSGNTSELKATVSCLKGNGVKIISLTGNPDSWLAEQGDVTLIAGVKEEGDPMNKPPRASIIVEILMLQSLSILLQEDFGLNPQQYVKWHPGGSLGASIREGK
ncbi:SIS domain-containing protein [uncultured Parolsenella sp.]|uniref:SIS domain-containing protein n=1 Tax=uncultured Parolsenella sp. TaxID=2083008 RepID=UPI0025E7CB5E|nr:SIS domain-containing protein [uncultured Parolsenella sp.]